MAELELSARGRFTTDPNHRPYAVGSEPTVVPFAAPEWMRSWPDDPGVIDPSEALDAPLLDMSTLSGEPRPNSEPNPDPVDEDHP
jgi:hypothetical protein